MSKKLVIGVFVGGRAARLGGVPKGLLRTADTNEPIVTRLARIGREALPGAELVLVGNAADYTELGHEAIADEPEGVGPLGGLLALLSRALTSRCDAVALAGDLPFVSHELLVRLAQHAPEGAVVAPRLDGVWHPLFARYRSAPCLAAARTVLARNERALHRVIAELGPRAHELPLLPEEAALLGDWDTPDDVVRPR
jgi:molybdopterin-guanine dinucleotide biosynthesis protein A